MIIQHSFPKELISHQSQELLVNNANPRGWLDALTNNPQSWTETQTPNGLNCMEAIWQHDNNQLSATIRPGLVMISAEKHQEDINNHPNRIWLIASRPIPLNANQQETWIIKSGAIEIPHQSQKYSITFLAGQFADLSTLQKSKWEKSSTLDLPKQLHHLIIQEPDWKKQIKQLFSKDQVNI